MQIINDFLPADLLDKCLKTLNERRDLPLWRVNKFVWDSELTYGFDGTIVFSQVPVALHKKITEHIKKTTKLDLDIDNDAVTMNFTMMDNNSGINWHQDHAYKWAITIYLNKKWESSYGGCLEYVDPHTQQKILHVPKFNTAAINDSWTYHCVTPIDNSAPVRDSIQIFCVANSKKELLEHHREELEIIKTNYQ